MQTIYITTPGIQLQKAGDTVIARKDGDTYHTIFPFRTEQVVLFGGVEMTRSAINFFLHHEIPVIFLSQNGRYNGQLVPPIGKNVFLRLQQYTKHGDAAFHLKLARDIVAGKIQNQMVIVKRIERFQKRDLLEAGRGLKTLLDRVPTEDNIESLRGLEGMASKIYFSVFDKGFIKPQGFKKRVRRPPTDPVNALLSLLYTFLFYRVDNVLQKRGLDPYFGHLHALTYGRRSLALDLVEEFRPVVADTLVFSLFNMNIINRADFTFAESGDDDQPPQDTPKKNEPQEPDVMADPMGGFNEKEFFVPAVYSTDVEEAGITSLDNDGHTVGSVARPVILMQTALQKVIKQFEHKLDTTFNNEMTGASTTYRRVFDEQAAQYIEVLRGEREHYQPLVLR
ncbi:MAG: CRISPR-associated endonuclease Cas1 [Deltaproteobacteria bacterium]|nr:CRISPR-associated endonuclease Cas1 [Deltaproteobacteria bacterium]